MNLYEHEKLIGEKKDSLEQTERIRAQEAVNLQEDIENAAGTESGSLPEIKDRKPVVSKTPEQVDYLGGAQEYEQNVRQVSDEVNYGLTVTQDQYQVIANAMANSDDPAATEAKFAQALIYSREMGIDLSTALANLDSLNKAQLGHTVPYTKAGYKAVADSVLIGQWSIQLAELKEKWYDATKAGADTRGIELEIEQLERVIEKNQDNAPRGLGTTLLKLGAQSLPYTMRIFLAGGVTGLGAAGATVGLGALLGGPAGAAAALAVAGTIYQKASMVGGFIEGYKLTKYAQYYDLVKEGVKPEVAEWTTTLSAAIQSAVEQFLGIESGVNRAISNVATGTTTRILAGMYAKGTFRRIAGVAAEYFKTGVSEGLEEFLQQLTEDITDNIARELSGTGSGKIVSKKEIRDAAEAFAGGFGASLVLGILPTAINTKATIKYAQDLRTEAQSTDSKQAFINSHESDEQFEGFSRKAVRETLSTVYDNARESGYDPEAREISDKEARAIDVGADMGEVVNTDENGEITGIEKATSKQPTKPLSRTDDGRIVSMESNDVRVNPDGSEKHLLILGGTDSKDEYGRIEYTLDGNKVRIDRLATFQGYEDIQADGIKELMRRYEGYEIVWDPLTEAQEKLKQQLTDQNPLGSDKGLNWFDGSYDIDMAAKVGKVIGEAFSNLTQDQMTTAAVLLDVMADAQGMNTAEYLKNYVQEFGSLDMNERGAFKVLSKNENGLKAAIYAGKKHDFSTFAHESFHLLRNVSNKSQDLAKAFSEAADTEQFEKFVKEHWNMLGGYFNNIQEVKKAAKSFTEDGNWTRDQDELAAHFFEAYLQEGKTFSEKLKNLFRKISEWFCKLYNTLRHNTQLNDNIIKAFDSMLESNKDLRQENSASESVGAKDEEKITIGTPERSSWGSDSYEESDEDNGLDEYGEPLFQSIRGSKEFRETEKTLKADKTNFDSVGNHLAPNGKISNLSYEQWVTVRTPSFIKWFGDWMKKALKDRITSLSPVMVSVEVDSVPDFFLKKGHENRKAMVDWAYEQVHRKQVSSEIGTVNISKSGINDALYHGHNKYKATLFSVLDDLIEQGVLVNKFAEHGKQNYVLVSKFSRSNGESDYVGLVIKEDENGNRYYNHTITQKNNWMAKRHPAKQTDSPTLHPAISSIIQDILDVNDDSVSKITDENGEPKLAFRGDMFWEKNNYIPGLFVSFDERFASNYGAVEELFINARNPFDGFRDAEGLRDFIGEHFDEIKDEFDDFFDEEDGPAYSTPDELLNALKDGWWTAYEQSELIREEILSRGFDAIHIFEEADNLWLESPAQIKSATRNAGTFDWNDPNILFQGELPDIQTRINQTMTMEQFEDMAYRTYKIEDIQGYKDWKEWLEEAGPENLALSMENERDIYHKFLQKLEAVGYNDDFSAEDIVRAYLNGTLTGNPQSDVPAARIDLTEGSDYKDSSFYSPQGLAEDIHAIIEKASQKATKANRSEVMKARADFVILAHNPGFAEAAGMTQSEVNKKLRGWTAYPANARDISQRLNYNVAEQNRWTGIENSNLMKSWTVSKEELGSLVKAIEGQGSDVQLHYIASVMLALDTHIDYSPLTIQFGANIKSSYGGVALGEYNHSNKTIRISRSSLNTVAHEIGHYLDNKWGLELSGYDYYLTDTRTLKHEDQRVQAWLDHFFSFLDSIEGQSARGSAYLMRGTETFARFVANFVEWTRNIAGDRYALESSHYHGDHFRESQFRDFVRILQEKAYIDSHGLLGSQEVLYQPAYHGSGADFDEFLENKIGSGQGSQNFGYGFYFSEADLIAKDYAMMGAFPESVRDEMIRQWTDRMESAQRAIRRYEKELEQYEPGETDYRILTNTIDKLDGDVRGYRRMINNYLSRPITRRNLYKVEIPDPEYANASSYSATNYIVWDRQYPINDLKNLIDNLKERLSPEDARAFEEYSSYMPDQRVSGENLYREISNYLGGPEKASDFLAEMGYEGIMYKAGQNMGLPQGVSSDTWNYVIFPGNRDHISITKHWQYDTDDEASTLYQNDLGSAARRYGATVDELGNIDLYTDGEVYTTRKTDGMSPVRMAADLLEISDVTDDAIIYRLRSNGTVNYQFGYDIDQIYDYAQGFDTFQEFEEDVHGPLSIYSEEELDGVDLLYVWNKAHNLATEADFDENALNYVRNQGYVSPATEDMDDKQKTAAFRARISTDDGVREFIGRLREIYSLFRETGGGRRLEASTEADFEAMTKDLDLMQRVYREASPFIKNLMFSKKDEISDKALLEVRGMMLKEENVLMYRDLYADVMLDPNLRADIYNRDYTLNDPGFGYETKSISERARMFSKQDTADWIRKVQSGQVKDEDLKKHINNILEERDTLKEQLKEKSEQLSAIRSSLSNEKQKQLKMLEDKADEARQLRNFIQKVQEKIGNGRRMTAEEFKKINSAQDRINLLNEEMKKLRHDDRVKAAAEKREAVKDARLELMKQYSDRQHQAAKAKELQEHKEQLARIITGKRLNDDVNWEQRREIEAIAAAVDPHNRRDKIRVGGVLMTVDEVRQRISSGEIPLENITDYMITRLTKTPLNEWTVAELEEMAEYIQDLRIEGKQIWQAKVDKRNMDAERYRNQIMHSVLAHRNHPDYTPIPNTPESEEIERSLRMRIRNVFNKTLNIDRKAQKLDNYNRGTAWRLLVDQRRRLDDKEYLAVQERIQPILDLMKAKDIKPGDLYKKISVALDTTRNTVMSVSDLAYVLYAELNTETYEAVAYGDLVTQEEKDQLRAGTENDDDWNNLIRRLGDDRFEAVKNQAKVYFDAHPEQMEIFKAIDDEWQKPENFDRSNAVTQEEYNISQEKVDHYMRIYRTQRNGLEMAQNQAEEMMAKYAPGTKSTPKRGQTKARLTISPSHQTPTRMDMLGTWMRSVEENEHLIAFTPWVRMMNRIFKNRGSELIRDEISATFGKGMWNDITQYISEVAVPSAFRDETDTDQILRTLRGGVYTGYLGAKVSSVVLQGISSPMPFLREVNPLQLAKGILQFSLHPKESWKFITELSPFMKRRSISPIAEEIRSDAADARKNKFSSAYHKFQNAIMQPLEWIDRWAVSGGWIACYEKKLSEFEYQNDIESMKKAAHYADTVVYQTQPNGVTAELSPMFKPKGAAWKTFVQFQTSLNTIWQNVTFDTATDFAKAHNYRKQGDSRYRQYRNRALMTLAGYAFAGLMLQLVTVGFDDDDDDKDKVRKLLYGSMTQFIDSVPLIGDLVNAPVESAVTGERVRTFSTALYPGLDKIANGMAGVIAGKDKGSAWLNIAKGAGLMTGFPVNGLNEWIEAISGKPEALLGRD